MESTFEYWFIGKYNKTIMEHFPHKVCKAVQNIEHENTYALNHLVS